MPKSLEGLHPLLIKAIGNILLKMDKVSHPMMVTDTVRTVAQQQALYAQGRTKPGKIVTNCDGVKIRSNHQVHSDGFGHAADLCFVVDGKPSWDIKLPWKLYGAFAKIEGLGWGGSWTNTKLVDLPHIELLEPLPPTPSKPT